MKIHASSHLPWVIVCASFLTSIFAQAQTSVVTGAGVSLGTAGTITIPDAGMIVKQQNLVESFNQFNVGAGATAKFVGSGGNLPAGTNIQNLVATVLNNPLNTGSTIGGTLQVVPGGDFAANVNFFLINPMGVTFNNGAHVLVPGDFVVSTANYFVLSDATKVQLDGTATGGTLAMAPVSAFGFLGGQAPAPINIVGNVNFNNTAGSLQFVGGDFTAAADATGSPSLAVTATAVPAILSIYSGAQTAGNQTVPYLTAGGITNYSGVTSALGHVALGRNTVGTVGGAAVIAGPASLSASGATGHVVIRGGAMVVQNATGGTASSITASSGSDLNVQADTNLALSQGSNITSNGNTDLNILSAGSLTLAGGSTISNTATAGNSGKVIVQAGSVSITKGKISTSTTTSGTAGSVSVTTTQTDAQNGNNPSVSIDGTTGASSISSSATGTGTDGAVSVNSGGSLSLSNGGTISTQTQDIMLDSLAALTLGSTASITSADGDIKIGSVTTPSGLTINNGTSIATTGAGAINIKTKATGTVAVKGQISTGTGDITIDGANVLNLTAGANNITSTSGNILLGTLTALGGLTVDTGTSITTRGTGAIRVNTTGAATVKIDGEVSNANGDIAIDSAQAVTLNGGTITSSGNISLGATNQIGGLSLDNSSAIQETGTGALVILSNGTVANNGTITTSASDAGGVSAFQIDAVTLNVTGGTLSSTGGGTLDIGANLAPSVTLSGATIKTTTPAGSPGGALNITFGNKLNLTNQSLIETTTTLSGNGGKTGGAITINSTTGVLTISAGSLIESLSTGGGTSGNVSVTAAKVDINGDNTFQTLDGVSVSDTGVFSKAMASSSVVGDAGGLSVTSGGALSLTGGSQIASFSLGTATKASGNAGTVLVTAGTNMTLLGASQIASVAGSHAGTNGFLAVGVGGTTGGTLDLGVEDGSAAKIYIQALNPITTPPLAPSPDDYGISVHAEHATVEVGSGASIQTIANDANPLNFEFFESSYDITLNALNLDLKSGGLIESSLTQAPTDPSTTALTGSIFINVKNLLTLEGTTSTRAILLDATTGSGTFPYSGLGTIQIETGALTVGGATLAIGGNGQYSGFTPTSPAPTDLSANSSISAVSNTITSTNTIVPTVSVSNFVNFLGTPSTPPSLGIVLETVGGVPVFGTGADNLMVGTGTVTPHGAHGRWIYDLDSTDGTLSGASGQNLFLSFSSFNLGSSGGAPEVLVFNFSNSVQNVIARVVGSTSTVTGSVFLTSPGNVFVLDPAGFNISNSTIAGSASSGALTLSTATRLKTSSNGVFTMATTALGNTFEGKVAQFGFGPASTGSITIAGSGLALDSQLQLLGGPINITGSTITDATSQIFLFSAAPTAQNSALLTFSGNDSLAAFPPAVTTGTPVPVVTTFSDSGPLGAISLTDSTLQSTSSDTGAPSTIYIRGGSFLLNGASADSSIQNVSNANDPGSSSGATIINVTGTATLEGTSGNSFISGSTTGGINGGTVEIDASALAINGNGGSTIGILSGTSAGGNGGRINLFLSNSLTMTNSGQISADTTGAGSGGTISVLGRPVAMGQPSLTPMVDLESGAVISSSANGGTGDAGNINVTASSLTLANDLVNNPSLQTEIATNTSTTGDAGVITVHVDGSMGPGNGDITIKDGGLISSTTEFNSSGKGGLINVTQGTSPDGFIVESNNTSNTFNFTGLVAFLEGIGDSAGAGPSTGANPVFAITVDTQSTVQILGGAQFTTFSTSSGAAGNISVQTHSQGLTVDGQGASFASEISSAAESSGAAGDIVLHTGTTTLSNGGQLTSATEGSASGGSVFLTADSLMVSGFNASVAESIPGFQSKGNSQITAGTYPSFGGAPGPGGSVALSVSGDLTVQDGGQITAATFSTGNAGSVTIGAQTLTVTGINATAAATPGATGASQISSGTFLVGAAAAGGAGGDVSLGVNGTLEVEHGGQILVTSTNAGKGGNNFVGQLSLADPTSGVATVFGAPTLVDINGQGIVTTGLFAEENGNGNSDAFNTANAAINLTTSVLTMENGDQINSSTSGLGNAGPIRINTTSLGTIANPSFLLTGATTLISSATTKATVTDPTTQSQGGNITITVNGQGTITGGGIVNAGTTGGGSGGSVTLIVTGDLSLTSGGQLTAGSGVNSTGQAGSVTVTQSSSTDLDVNANAGIFIDGTGGTSQISTSENAQSTGTNQKTDVGSITINAQQLTLSHGGGIVATTSGPFYGGNITLTIATGPKPNLNITGGSAISASSLGTGAAGTVTVTQANEILVDGAGSRISTDAGPTGSSVNASAPNQGDININAQNLSVKNGGSITATTGLQSDGVTSGAGLSPGGTITLTIPGGVLSLTSGGTINASSFAMGGLDPITLTMQPGGNGGNINIGNPNSALLGLAASPDATSPNVLDILNGSQITASSEFTSGGDISIFTETANIQHGSSVETKGEGSGGNITINAGVLFYLNDFSDISTHSAGQGGNITIDPEFEVLNHSFIDAFGGTGDGNVIILSNFTLSGNSSITATGTVTIASLPLDLSGSLVGLPADLTDEAKRLRESCARAVNHEFSSLIVVGRSGTETAPDELNSDSGSGDGGSAPASSVRAQEKLR